jgi:GNAT superfamily N-acetyltransferase
VTDELLAAYDRQLRRYVPPTQEPGVTYEQLGPVLRVTGWHVGSIEPSPDLGVTGEQLDALIREHRDHFAARGEAVEWKTRGHDLPPDVPERLVAAGFVAEPTETVVVARSADVAAEPRLPEGVQLRAVRELSDLQRIAAMEAAVWGGDHTWRVSHLQGLIDAAGDDVVVLVAEAAGEVVSAGWLVYQPGTDFAGLWGGSTLEPWRGRGIYRALVARRAQDALARGVPYLQVDASDDSRPILERLGFRAITTTTPYVWSPPST